MTFRLWRCLVIVIWSQSLGWLWSNSREDKLNRRICENSGGGQKRMGDDPWSFIEGSWPEKVFFWNLWGFTIQKAFVDEWINETIICHRPFQTITPAKRFHKLNKSLHPTKPGTWSDSNRESDFGGGGIYFRFVALGGGRLEKVEQGVAGAVSAIYWENLQIYLEAALHYPLLPRTALCFVGYLLFREMTVTSIYWDRRVYIFTQLGTIKQPSQKHCKNLNLIQTRPNWALRAVPDSLIQVNMEDRGRTNGRHFWPI